MRFLQIFVNDELSDVFDYEIISLGEGCCGPLEYLNIKYEQWRSYNINEFVFFFL